MAVVYEKSSPFYPPRARWYNPALATIDGARRSVALDRLNPPLVEGVNLLELVASFVLPALGFYFRLPKLIGLALLGWACLLVLGFFVFLGRWEDNFIFSMLLSLHVSGFVFYCTPLLGRSLPRRLGFTFGTAIAIYLLIYLPVQALLQDYVVEPLQTRDGMVVIRPILSGKSIRVGDRIAYTVASGYEENGVYVQAGTNFAQVLAGPGDQITFDSDTYIAHGVAHPRLPHMPQGGKQIVPQKEWFVWPNNDIEERRAIAESSVTHLLMRMALVTEDQLIGKPFANWFWWSQK